MSLLSDQLVTFYLRRNIPTTFCFPLFFKNKKEIDKENPRNTRFSGQALQALRLVWEVFWGWKTSSATRLLGTKGLSCIHTLHCRNRSKGALYPHRATLCWNRSKSFWCFFISSEFSLLAACCRLGQSRPPRNEYLDEELTATWKAKILTVPVVAS